MYPPYSGSVGGNFLPKLWEGLFEFGEKVRKLQLRIGLTPLNLDVKIIT
jgi:hypothetical protein